MLLRMKRRITCNPVNITDIDPVNGKQTYYVEVVPTYDLCPCEIF
jgi:hypothetical protein